MYFRKSYNLYNSGESSPDSRIRLSEFCLQHLRQAPSMPGLGSAHSLRMATTAVMSKKWEEEEEEENESRDDDDDDDDKYHYVRCAAYHSIFYI